MGFRIKLDEALSASLATILRASGYDVHTVREQGWGGMNDSALWVKVQEEGIFFITADKGFGDIRQFPPGTHAGVLLLRPDSDSLSSYQTLVKELVETHRLESLVGTVSVATPRGMRIRRRPG
jgi:predicted nuclease of predicted toxin-antitoxin system